MIRVHAWRSLRTTIAILVPILFTLVACSAETTARALPAVLGDLVPTALVLPDEVAPPPVPLLPAAHAQALAPDAALHERPDPTRASGRGFWRVVDGRTLHEGLELVTLAPGAVLRVQTSVTQTRAFDPIGPDDLELQAHGRTWSPAEAFALRDDAQRSAGAMFGPSTAVAVLSPELGAGALTLLAPTIDPMASVLVHVHEPASALQLVVHTDADTYLHGQTATIRATLRRDGKKVSVETMHARIRDPDGVAHAIELSPGDVADEWQAAWLVDRRVPDRGRVWTVEVQAEHRDADDRIVRRSARTAFASAVPTARLGPDPEVRLEHRSRTIAWPVQVVAAGRYALMATVWATGPDGDSHPVAHVQSADYLVPGDAELRLALADELASEGVLELRDLRLHDQGRLAVLHRQARAAMIAADP